MRTLTGHEAIDVAQRMNILIFDRSYSRELTAEQAKLLIQQKQHDAALFVLEDWPDTDKEAEQCVLRRYHTAMITKNMVVASLADVCRSNEEERGIHPVAADLAAKRLVEHKELAFVRENHDGPVYQLPRSIRFTDPFLDGLRNLVCHDCAHLNPDKSFHKTCLLAIIDYLINGDFVLADVTITEDAYDDGVKLPNSLKQGIGSRWLSLSQTVSATKGKLKSVVGPILSRESANDAVPASTEAKAMTGSTIAQATPEDSVHEAVPADPGAILARNKISKTELISYLRSVEIIDEDGELAELKAQCHQLHHQLGAKDHEMMKLERQRAFLQQQCDDMQRDMDTLLQAMQIAKRRGHTPAPVIDAEIHVATDE